MVESRTSRGAACWRAWLRRECPVSLQVSAAGPRRPGQRRLRLAWHVTPLGCLFVAVGERGISRLHFRRPGVSHEQLRRQLLRDWPGAGLVTDAAATAGALAPLLEQEPALEVRLDVVATPFQARVWQALLEVGPGETVDYGELAVRIGQPTASRAVGRAVGANPVALLIPCHRVVPLSGGVGNYRWGVARKRRLLAVERYL